MPNRSRPLLVPLLGLLLAAAAADARAESPVEFEISIDAPMHQKWGLRYPVTYVFHVSDISGQATVSRQPRQLSSTT